MATPVVAGAAILVRQYFTDGFYPEGRADSSRSLNPSAALVKVRRKTCVTVFASQCLRPSVDDPSHAFPRPIRQCCWAVPLR